MASELRKTGISIVGDVPWGTHFCHFYETKQDLLDTLVPYFKAGLENKEFCLWVVSNSELVTVEEAKRALEQAVPDLDRHLSDQNIEILNGLGWYLEENVFNLERITNKWDAKLKRALALGYDGMRVSGDTLWLRDRDWIDFSAYEKQLNDSIVDRPMTLLCTYPLAKSGAAEILDVVQTHQFAVARRQGEWEVIETSELIQAKAEIKRINEELEQRVAQRTRELVAANAALKREIHERRRVEEELRERAEDLAEAQRVARIGNWSYDLRTNKVIWSEELYRIFGIEKRDFDGHHESFVSRIHPDDQPRVLRTNAQTRIHGLPFDIEYRVITPRGQVRIIREVGYATQDEAGEVIRLFGTAQDITERKQSDAALRESEEKFRQMAENIREVFWMSTTDFHGALYSILYISPAYESVWGRTCESLYRDPRSFVDAIHPDDRSRVVDLIASDCEKGFEVEFRVVRPDGSICWIWNRGFPIQDESGRFYRVAGIAEDISERKLAEAFLHAKEEEFRAIVESAPDQIIRYDREFRRAYVNPAVAKAYGLPAEDLTGKPIGSVIQDVDLDVKEHELAQVRQRIAAVFDTGKSYEYELTWPMPTGRRYFNVRLCPELDLNGSVVNVLGISRDITERKQAEEQLKQSESQLAEAQHLAHVGSWSLDLPSNTVTWSEELYRMFGVRPSEFDHSYEAVIGTIHPEDRDLVRGLVENALKTHEPFSFNCRMTRPTGEVRVLHARGVVVTDEHGNPTRMYGAAQDVTKRQQAEERLRATTEQLRALSASLLSAREEEATRIAREIHDELGAALSSLRWDLEDVDEGISEWGDESKIQELRKKIEAMTTLTDTTINSVRRIASELRPIALDALGLVEAIQWQARQFQDRTEIMVRCDCDLANPGLSREKSTAVFRIFQEALTNILRHAHATKVNVLLNQEDGAFIVTISDNGRGITDDEKSGQLTLGLLGMRERAYLIGGKIDIAGFAGKGTVVTVRIPV